MKPEIVDYDIYDYDYTQYWKDRQYENNSEHIALEKLLKDESGEWFIDIGGSYGRLADVYAKKFKRCVILDYSLKTLIKNKVLIEKQFPNCILIAANAYKMPFKENVFDGGLMVRVLHHIERQKEYIQELTRVLKKDAEYIQEYANKIHLKARIRAFLSKDRNFNSLKPYQQPTIHLEGAKGDGVQFLNYHPKYIENLFVQEGFEIEQKQGCSFLRIPFLKKLLGTKILTFFEKYLQILFAKSNIPPSIFVKTELEVGEDGGNYQELDYVLACPNCKGLISIDKDSCYCEKCKKKYFRKSGVWDFRID
jgi:ubiquinone/menaquinone biosynthesis C-methylase UbiE